jgi:hypothetical protein
MERLIVTGIIMIIMIYSSLLIERRNEYILHAITPFIMIQWACHKKLIS